MSRRVLHKIKMRVGYVTKTNGELHRQCGVNIPTDIASKYPDDQQFDVEEVTGGILYIPFSQEGEAGHGKDT
jgi:hypothetical protein